MTAAAYNVRININSLTDISLGDHMLSELGGFESAADKLEGEMKAVMKERGGI